MRYGGVRAPMRGGSEAVEQFGFDDFRDRYNLTHEMMAIPMPFFGGFKIRELRELRPKQLDLNKQIT